MLITYYFLVSVQNQLEQMFGEPIFRSLKTHNTILKGTKPTCFGFQYLQQIAKTPLLLCTSLLRTIAFHTLINWNSVNKKAKSHLFVWAKSTAIASLKACSAFSQSQPLKLNNAYSYQSSGLCVSRATRSWWYFAANS